MIQPPFEPLGSPLAPVEVVSGLSHLPGLQFFDTAGNARGGEGISVVAADPVAWLRGEIGRDWGLVERELARWRCARGAAGLSGLPRGLVAGGVAYDGRFLFGVYPEMMVYSRAAGGWWGSPRLMGRVRAMPEPVGGAGPLRFAETLGRDGFCRIVRRALEYIAAGDIYQVNLARRYAAAWAGDPFAYYLALREVSPTPYAAYLDLGEVRLASASPELFLGMSGGRIATRPIKGTRARREHPEEDRRSARELEGSEKERAELVMITDLERNDLGQVCGYGSVRVAEMGALERYEQVYHLVSTVEGVLREGVGHEEAFRACFPGGSITGAPKRRAREILAELEPVGRGFYTGALGYFGMNGESQFNIAIRTAVFEGGEASFHAGAGIVADSDPEREYEETVEKASALLAAAGRV